VPYCIGDRWEHARHLGRPELDYLLYKVSASSCRQSFRKNPTRLMTRSGWAPYLSKLRECYFGKVNPDINCVVEVMGGVGLTFDSQSVPVGSVKGGQVRHDEMMAQAQAAETETETAIAATAQGQLTFAVAASGGIYSHEPL
jgi:hypothetical protein